VLTVPGLCQAEGSAPIIAVFDVETKGIQLAAHVVDSLSDYVASRLAESGKFQVVPRAQLKARLAEAKTESYKECYDESCQIALGREVAAQKTLATRIAKVGSQCMISLNVFDLGRATSETASTASGACTEDGLVASLGAAIEKLTGTAAPASQPGPGRTPVLLGVGTVESGIIIDKGQSIVNQVTDQTGFLVIKSEPTGAIITLNGKEMGKAPLQIEQMVGRYVLVAEIGKLYRPARQEIDLDQTGKRVTLTLPPAFGRLEVTSDPSGAEVSLDGERVGTTPWSADPKPSASYVVRVEKANYLRHESSVVVEDGKTAVVKAALQQNFGSLVVDSNPPGAAITLNDEATGQKTPFTFPTLQPGIAVVKLGLEGYGDAVQRATVLNREIVKMSVTLKGKMGLLVVTSAYDDGTPCEGEVSFDGKAVGQTPWKQEVLAVPHKVRVVCPDGEASASVNVVHNERRPLALSISAPGRRKAVALPSAGPLNPTASGPSQHQVPGVAAPAPAHKTSVGAWVIFGTGLAGLVTGGVLTWAAHNESGKLASSGTYPDGTSRIDRSRAAALQSQAKTYQNASTAMYAIGGAATLAGLVWGIVDLVHRPAASHAETGPKPVMSVAGGVVPLPGGAVVMVNIR
jgi:hypothetical protein